MDCVILCLLSKHTGSIGSVAVFFFPLCPTGHGLLAVIIVYKGTTGTLGSASIGVYDIFVEHLKSMVGIHCPKSHV